MKAFAVGLLFFSGWTVWTEPGDAIRSEAWRSKSQTRFLTAAGDFDGDGKIDQAKLVVAADDGRRNALIVQLSSTGDQAQTITEIEGGLTELGVATVAPGKYKTACGKGYGDWACEHGEPKVLKLRNSAIDFFKNESAETYYVWDGKTKAFAKIAISD
jgi:hypothetical protein